jgi:hypothetical protein
MYNEMSDANDKTASAKDENMRLKRDIDQLIQQIT